MKRLNDTYLVKNGELVTAKRKPASLKHRVNAAFDLLEDWNAIWRFLLWFIPAPSIDNELEPTTPGTACDKNIEKETCKSKQTLEDEANQKREDKKNFRNEIELASANSTLSSLATYVLPLLYGLLGSLAYILRSLAREVVAVTFSEVSRTRFRLRWPLGMLAGIAIGWFFDPSNLPGIEALQPLALAFLAGYSVELLFTGLDKTIATFTNEGQVPPPKPVPANPGPVNPVPANPVPANPVPANPVPDKPVPDKPVPANPVPDKPVSDKPVSDKSE